MKTHFNYEHCNLYSTEDKHFLACKGTLYMVTKDQINKILGELVGKAPVDKAQYLTELAEKETFKKIHI